MLTHRTSSGNATAAWFVLSAVLEQCATCLATGFANTAERGAIVLAVAAVLLDAAVRATPVALAQAAGVGRAQAVAAARVVWVARTLTNRRTGESDALHRV